MAAQARLGWLGHGSVLVDIDGVRLLCDPVLRTRVAHLRRHVPVPAGLVRGVDAVLLTHLHQDHLDLPSLERLGRDLPVVLPRGAARLLRRRRFTHVVEVAVGESIRIGAVDVLATAAEHDGARPPFGPTVQALGFVVQGSRRVYVAGDTGLFPEMTRIGPLDAAALPVGGWGPNLGPGHMDPAQAAEAVTLVRAPDRRPDPLRHLRAARPRRPHRRAWPPLRRPGGGACPGLPRGGPRGRRERAPGRGGSGHPCRVRSRARPLPSVTDTIQRRRPVVWGR